MAAQFRGRPIEPLRKAYGPEKAGSVLSHLAGGELLGDMLEKHPDDMERALTRWEEKLRPFIEDMQRDSLKARQLFTPAGQPA
ncbi:hypothetical protein JRI60_26615 [Archangium violaceum]|uniref:hypothetical protein n=1 Tax=Archangium violaceum TaxID=83451 RepID=UPI0019502B71|nr:hypothetical protein [Archangium violaceum]QRN92786.1 hypothetical protein JRI60_26615 [Archangium violaceum]